MFALEVSVRQDLKIAADSLHLTCRGRDAFTHVLDCSAELEVHLAYRGALAYDLHDLGVA